MASAAAAVDAGWEAKAAATRAEIEGARTALDAALTRRRAHIRELVDHQGRTKKEVAAAYGIDQARVIQILATPDN